MNKLALNGGTPVRTKPFPHHPVIGNEEKRAVMEVLDSGHLSTFVGAPGKNFLGGKKVKELEQLFMDYHKTEYAVVFNSATAALHGAIVACDVQPGEEIVTTPYTFTSTATSAFMHNAVPVFADVQNDTCNIDPVEVSKKISKLTRVIIPVHLFGNPADMKEIMEIAEDNRLKVIEDCAQAPGSRYQNKLVGTIGDCGIFSLTETKNITSGEGGVLITNDKHIAEICRLIRNHGEAVIAEQKRRTYKSLILGYNYRMTEVDAAIGCEQFKRLDKLNDVRVKLSNHLTKHLKDIDGLVPLEVRNWNYHTYHFYAMLYDESKIGISRDLFLKAVECEGIPIGGGYVKPLYYSPIFHTNKPFIFEHYKGCASYEPGLCPVAEKLHFKELIGTVVPRPPATIDDMNDVIVAVKKVIENVDIIRRNEK